jgi:hypothetical protein
MHLIQTETGVEYIWEVGNELIFVSEKSLKNTHGDFMTIEGNKRCSDRFVCDINKNEIKIFDEKFMLIKKILIEYPTGISFYGGIDTYIIRHGIEKDKYSIFFQDKFLKGEEASTMGKTLNSEIRLNFKHRFEPISYFRCSNLTDSETYWIYECDEEQVIGGFTVFQEKLLFYTTEKDKEPYQAKYWLNILDITTGQRLHHIECRNRNACFDAERGLFVAVAGSTQNRDNIKIYEIIDVTTGERLCEDMKEDVSFYWVGTNIQYLAHNCLYFIDNSWQIGEEKINVNPKIGCFNFIKKELVYFKTLPEITEKQISQIMVHENKIYLRTVTDELYVFEDDVVV